MGRLENDVFSTCRYRFCQFFGCRCEFDQFALGLDTGVDGLLLLDFKTLVEAQFNTHPICCLLFVGLPFLAHFCGCWGLIHAGVVSRLPLLQLFRFPSMYRGFAMFFWLYSIFVLIQGQSTTKPWISWAFAVSMVLEMGWYAHQNRFNTVFAQIPANQVNAVLDDCVNRDHRTISGLPWRLPVDTQEHWNQQIPFMNQNQGIYLKIWASDGYNPYRFKSGENNAVQGDSQGGAILGLNAKGNVVKGGILSCKQVEENGEQIKIQGLMFDTAVTDIVIMQTPHKFWNQQGESMGEGWCNYKNCGMKMKAQTNVNLKYEPKYFAMGIFFGFSAG